MRRSEAKGTAVSVLWRRGVASALAPMRHGFETSGLVRHCFVCYVARVYSSVGGIGVSRCWLPFRVCSWYRRGQGLDGAAWGDISQHVIAVLVLKGLALESTLLCFLSRRRGARRINGDRTK